MTRCDWKLTILIATIVVTAIWLLVFLDGH